MEWVKHFLHSFSPEYSLLKNGSFLLHEEQLIGFDLKRFNKGSLILVKRVLALV